MVNSQIKKIEAITPKTLIVGVDIAKNIHWSQFTDFRGIEVSKHLRFENNYSGFKSILEKIDEIKKQKNLNHAIVGMEPTGHYWKPLAAFLEANNINVVLVNPYHTKRAKELDDNSQTKNDKKDALTISKLVKDGRYSEMYLPKEEYAELRNLSNARLEINRSMNNCKNRIHAFVDEYFPEFPLVFKTFITGKTALHILKKAPFPTDILKLGLSELISLMKESVKKTVGEKKAKQLLEMAQVSIGVKSGLEGARIRLMILLEQYELYLKQLETVDLEMEKQLELTGYKEILLSIPAIGIVSAASFLGEIGDPKRFSSPQQIVRLAGYNLIENSSGNLKSKTIISKRGRKILRSILYKIALVMVAKNNEMKLLYKYLLSRKSNPLKKKQALIAVAEKVIKVLFALMKQGKKYDSNLVLGEYRMKQIAA